MSCAFTLLRTLYRGLEILRLVSVKTLINARGDNKITLKVEMCEHLKRTSLNPTNTPGMIRY